MAKNKKSSKDALGRIQITRVDVAVLISNNYNRKSKELKWNEEHSFILLKRAITMPSFRKDYKD